MGAVRRITGEQLRDAIGRSGLRPEEAQALIGVKSRATYYAWRDNGVPDKDVPRVADRLASWLHAGDTVPQPPLNRFSNLELLTELTRRLAVVERLALAEDHEEPQRESASPESLTDGTDGPGAATIVGRGPSQHLGGNDGSKRGKDDR